MVHTTYPSVLALQLPDPRFSIDFNNYSLDTSAYAISRKYMQDLFPGQNKPLPTQKAGTLHARPSHGAQRRCSPLAACTTPNKFGKYDQASLECPIMLDESPFSAPTRPSASPNSTTATTSASSTSNSPAKGAYYVKKQRIHFLDLPETTIEQILGYVLTEEGAVSITPHQSRTSPQHLHQQQDGPDMVDLRSIMVHPALLVSQQIRALGSVSYTHL